jgi:hypothetical protein
VTFFATFLTLLTGRFLEPADSLREVFFAPFLVPLEAGFLTFPAALAAFLGELPVPRADLEAFLEAFLAAGLAGFAAGRALPAFLDAPVSTAAMAARIRSISCVTCSMVIMPSTVSNLRRSE